MEDDLTFFVNERQPLVFQMKGKLRMEDDPNFLPHIFGKWKMTLFLCEWKITSFFSNGIRPQEMLMEEDIIDFLMEFSIKIKWKWL
jgi:hypothetical protein